jgi:hypothetical protein
MAGGDGIIDGTATADHIHRGHGDDVVQASTAPTASLATMATTFCSAAPAQIAWMGIGARDVLFGSADDDIIGGGSGNDLLMGGRRQRYDLLRRLPAQRGRQRGADHGH